MPIEVPAAVEFTIDEGARTVKVKGPKGEIIHNLHPSVALHREDNVITVSANAELFDKPDAIAGTTRALLSNHVHGVTEGFVKKLTLVGVGYRAAVKKGKSGRDMLEMNLGFSHPVFYEAPEGIEFKAPSATEIEVHGFDKQRVGQVAAEIREFRRPEPYKGKGVRYFDEVVTIKETKK